MQRGSAFETAHLAAKKRLPTAPRCGELTRFRCLAGDRCSVGCTDGGKKKKGLGCAFVLAHVALHVALQQTGGKHHFILLSQRQGFR